MTKEKKGGKKNSDSISNEIMLSFFAAFSIGFFIPFDLYASNISEINIPIPYVMISIISVSFLIFLTVFLLLLFTKGKGKANHICTCTVIALTLGEYIQSNFLSVNLGIINGERLEQNAGGMIVNLILWAALIAGVFYGAGKYEWVRTKAFRYAAAAVVIMETAALSMSCVVVWSYAAIVKNSDNSVVGAHQYVCTTMDLDLYSSDKNVIIFFTDAYDSFCFDAAAKECPEAISEFDGFTYYTNTVGMYSGTIEAIPYITTGHTLSQEQLETPCFDDRFYKNMYSSYKSNIYGIEDVINREIMMKYSDNYIEKKVTFGDCVKICKAFYKVALFKSVPEIIKPLFYPGMDNFHIDFEFSKDSSHTTYSYNNLDFYENMPQTLRITEEKCFKLIYTLGVHHPRNTSADLQYLGDAEIDPEEVAVAVNKILNQYLSTLKNAGVYENSEIFILADHGIPETKAMYPLLLYKPAGNADEGITVSNAPISYADLYPTMLKISGEEPDERTIFDIGEDEERERYYSATDTYVTGNIKKAGALS